MHRPTPSPRTSNGGHSTGNQQSSLLSSSSTIRSTTNSSRPTTNQRRRRNPHCHSSSLQNSSNHQYHIRQHQQHLASYASNRRSSGIISHNSNRLPPPPPPRSFPHSMPASNSVMAPQPAAASRQQYHQSSQQGRPGEMMGRSVEGGESGVVGGYYNKNGARKNDGGEYRTNLSCPSSSSPSAVSNPINIPPTITTLQSSSNPKNNNNSKNGGMTSAINICYLNNNVNNAASFLTPSSTTSSSVLLLSSSYPTSSSTSTSAAAAAAAATVMAGPSFDRYNNHRLQQQQHQHQHQPIKTINNSPFHTLSHHAAAQDVRKLQLAGAASIYQPKSPYGQQHRNSKRKPHVQQAQIGHRNHRHNNFAGRMRSQSDHFPPSSSSTSSSSAATTRSTAANQQHRNHTKRNHQYQHQQHQQLQHGGRRNNHGGRASHIVKSHAGGKPAKTHQLPRSGENDRSPPLLTSMSDTFDRLTLKSAAAVGHIDDGQQQQKSGRAGVEQQKARKKQQKLSMAKMLGKRDMGLINSTALSNQVIHRGLAALERVEPRLIDVDVVPGEGLRNCQFLERDPAGTCLMGVWSRTERNGYRIIPMDVTVNGKEATETSHGLAVKTGMELDRNSSQIVDMCLAPVDSCVTCLLYVSSPNYGIHMCPVDELSSMGAEDEDFLGSPMYNIDWTMARNISSCAWNSHKMRIGLGIATTATVDVVDGYGLIVDVVTETDFRLSTRHKSVTAQQFSKDGDLVYYGLRDWDTVCCDLRLPSHHHVFSLGQRNVHAINIVGNPASNPNQILLASSNSSQLKLWDIRFKTAPVMEYTEHRNSGGFNSKVSVTMDDTQNLLFAVGTDEVTRGWNVQSGELLCQLPLSQQDPHRSGGAQTTVQSTVSNRSSSLPRLAYHNRWGRTPGVSALIMAANQSLYCYEIKL